MIYRIRFTARAKRHLKELDRWWSENRSSAIANVVDEVERVSNFLQEMPAARPVYKRRKSLEFRRCRLGSTPYFLYYTIDVTKEEIVISAVWSGPRGEDPPL